jgi:hypothetical protein
MNWSHVRRISIVMRALEDALVEIEDAVRSTPRCDKAMSIYEDDIPSSLKPSILLKVRQIRNQIREVKEYYGLEEDRVSNRRRLSSRLILLAIDVTEATSKYLRSYGDVPEEEKGPLDERMTRIEKAVAELQKIMNAE